MKHGLPLLTALLLAPLAALHAAAAPKPNIVLMPTLCALAGGKPPRDLKWDGHDIFPVLTGSTQHPGSRILYRKGPDHASAVSDAPWKLIVTGKTVELYNLTKDIGEKVDLAAQNPDLVRQLHAKLETQSAKDNDAVPNQTVSP